MAIYRINPGDFALGVGVPTGFTERWSSDAGTVYEVIADVDSPSGRSINITVPSSSRRLLSYDAVNADVDRGTIDMIALVRSNLYINATYSYGGPMGRGSGGFGTEIGQVGVLADNGELKNLRYRHPTSPTISAAAGAGHWTLSEVVWLRVQISGTSITSTIYPEVDPLGTPIVSHTSTCEASNADDWIGIFTFATDTDIDFLYIGIGTGADSAPLPLTAISFSGTVPTQNLTEDSAMSALDLSAYFSGAETPFSYAVQSGTLPAGLSLNASTGVISGTPTALGTASIVVRGTDNLSATVDTNSFDIVVEAAVAAVEGVSVILYDAAVVQASITDIHYLVTSGEGPEATELVSGIAELTDGSGVLVIDLSATAAAVDDVVYVCVFKRDATVDADSLGFQGMLTVGDIA